MRATLLFATACAVAGANMPCVPKGGHTLIAIGQDQQSIAEYARYFGAPDVVSAYTAISNLQGLSEAVDYGGGVQHASALLAAYPGSAMLLAVYAVDELENITAGVRDDEIDSLADWITLARVPVYVRFGYEFDNPGNRYEPRAYVNAFRYLVDRVRARGVPNFATVWHSWGFEPAAGSRRKVTDWYPGDEYVDWVGLSAFQQLLTGETRQLEFVADFAKAHGIPLMICEATPFGGLRPRPAPRAIAAADSDGSKTAGAPPAAPPAPPSLQDGKDTWGTYFSPLLAFVRKHEVRLLTYIDCDWSSQPMWKGQGWGDTRLEAEPAYRRLWRNRVLNMPRFHVGPDERSCESGTTTGLAPPVKSLPPHTGVKHDAPSKATDEASAKALKHSPGVKAMYAGVAGVSVIVFGALVYFRRSLQIGGALPPSKSNEEALLVDGEGGGAVPPELAASTAGGPAA
jgi:hypothetical protein